MRGWVERATAMAGIASEIIPHLTPTNTREMAVDAGINVPQTALPVIIRRGPRPEIRILIHPLWDFFNPQDCLAEAVAIANAYTTHMMQTNEWERPSRTLFHDTFNLSRRPSWTFQNPFETV